MKVYVLQSSAIQLFYGCFLSQLMKSSRICNNETCHFGTLIIQSCRHLKNSKYREIISLNFQSLPIDGFSKRNSVVINPLPRSCINQGKLTHVTGEETRNDTPPRPTLSQTSHTSHLCLTLIYKGVEILKAYRNVDVCACVCVCVRI